MSIEKTWEAIAPRALSANGKKNGELPLTNAKGFKVGMRIFISSNTLTDPKEFKIKRITGNSLFVGPIDKPVQYRSDVSAYTLADTSAVWANEQEKVGVPFEDRDFATFEHEPANARRVIQVDELGIPYSEQNPFPVGFSADNPIPVVLTDGSINIGTVEAQLEVQLSSKDTVDRTHDSIRIGDQNNEATVTKAVTGTKAGLDVNALNEAFNKPYNKLTVLTKNDDGNPLTIRSRYFGTDVQLMTIIWDADGDFEDFEVVDL